MTPLQSSLTFDLHYPPFRGGYGLGWAASWRTGWTSPRRLGGRDRPDYCRPTSGTGSHRSCRSESVNFFKESKSIFITIQYRTFSFQNFLLRNFNWNCFLFFKITVTVDLFLNCHLHIKHAKHAVCKKWF